MNHIVLQIFLPLNTTTFAVVSQTLFEIIEIAGVPCNRSLDFSFDQIVEVDMEDNSDF